MLISVFTPAHRSWSGPTESILHEETNRILLRRGRKAVCVADAGPRTIGSFERRHCAASPGPAAGGGGGGRVGGLEWTEYKS